MLSVGNFLQPKVWIWCLKFLIKKLRKHFGPSILKNPLAFWVHCWFLPQSLAHLVPKVPNPIKVDLSSAVTQCTNALQKSLQLGLKLLTLLSEDLSKREGLQIISFWLENLWGDIVRIPPSPKCAMKVNIMKVHDNIRWEFLWDLLYPMNFTLKW